MIEYNYQCRNKSLLSHGFTAFFVHPLLKVIPRSLPANYISVISHFAVYLALYFSYVNGRPTVNFVLVSVLILLHLMGDKMDGIRARNTNTASPLGELIDHFFEVFNTGSIVFILFHLFDFSHQWILLFAVISALMVSMAKYYEQYKNGVRIIDRFGLFELKLMVLITILATCFEPVFIFLNQPYLYDYSIVEVGLLLAAAGGSLSFGRSYVRTKHVTYGFWLFIGLLLLVGISSFIVFEASLAAIITLFYGGLYVGNLLSGQLVDGVERSPGLFTPLFLFIHLVTDYFDPQNTFLILMIYLLVNLLITIIRAFKALKMYWHWVNPQ